MLRPHDCIAIVLCAQPPMINGSLATETVSML
jgi:hypothetical protein